MSNLARRAATRTRSSLRRLAQRALAAASSRLGYQLVRDNFYSPLVDRELIPLEQPRDAMPGIAFDAAEQLRYLTEQLAPYLAEVAPPNRGALAEIPLRNAMYEAFDAEVLYAIVRQRRPARVLELGSGFTTRIIAGALAANGSGEHQVFDPYADPAIDALATVQRRSAAEISDAELAALSAGDILFVDSTHIVKLGSEVNRIVLDALPRLATGVAVHFHDVYLPWDYPAWYFDQGMFFNEQYLIQAFLALNPSYRVLLGTHALGRLYPADVAGAIPSVRDGASPCAFWIERTA